VQQPADPLLTRAHSRSRKSLTSPAVIASTPHGSPAQIRPARNRRANCSLARTVTGANPRSQTSHWRYSPTNRSTGAATAGGSGETAPSARRYSSSGQALAPGKRPRSTRYSARKPLTASALS